MTALGITLGGPCGALGPEILIKSLPHLSQIKSKFIIFGDKNYLQELSKKFKVTFPYNTEIISLSELKINPGEPTRETHLASIKYLEEAIKWLKKREISGIITLPINKEAFEVSGLPYKGHTEMLVKEFSAQKLCHEFLWKKTEGLLGYHSYSL